MRKVLQTIFEPPKGNCFAACVASLLDLDLDDVPNFAALDEWRKTETGWELAEKTNKPKWWLGLGDFLKARSMAAIEFLPQSKWGMTDVDQLGIATVESSRGNYLHCVVADLATGRVVWDPYPGVPEGRTLYADDLVSWIILMPVVYRSSLEAQKEAGNA